MNGIVRIPQFMEGESLDEGYYDIPDPYADPPKSRYDLRAMVNYALVNGKQITELTREETEPFLLKQE